MIMMMNQIMIRVVGAFVSVVSMHGFDHPSLLALSRFLHSVNQAKFFIG